MQIRDLDFESFVKTNLGDIAIWNNDEYISPKIKLYYAAWQAAITEKAQLFSDLLKVSRYLNLYHLADGGLITMDRTSQLCVIFSNFGHFNDLRK